METPIPDLSYIIDLMKKQSGIIFTKDKSYVILTKLYPLIEKYKFNNIEELLLNIKSNKDPELISDMVDNLTINETSFFRDRYPFEALEKYIIPRMIENDPTKRIIRILCTACSTGQEPYSLIMHFLENKKHNLMPKITAVDLSSIALEKAKLGIYNQFEIQRGLPITHLVKYFTQTGKDWIIKDELKNQVTFKKFNLKSDLSVLGQFDLVFCRNVLIYFEENLRKEVINKLVKVMASKASLFLGGTETIGWEDHAELTKLEQYNGIYTLKS